MKEKISKYFIYFMLYSIIGWIYEVFIEFFISKLGFVNRGILFGPYCPVYGFGSVLFLFTIYPLIKNKKGWKKYLLIPVVFALCMLVATIVELVTSYLCEFAIGSWPWQTYSEYKYNFQARIALPTSIRFGIGGVVFLYVLQPLFEKICDKLGEKKTKIIAIVLFAIIFIDFIFTIFKYIHK